MAFKFEDKEMYPIFVFAKCCWLVHCKWYKAWQERAEQTEKRHSHTICAVSRQVYVHDLLVQHLYSAFFQYMVCYGPISKTGLMQRRQKKTILQSWRSWPVKFTLTVRIILIFFSSPSNFVAVRFASLKKFTINCTSVLLLSFFTALDILHRKL